jgi:hypothetical protein
MHPAGFKPATPASKRPQNPSLDSAVFTMPVLIKDKKTIIYLYKDQSLNPFRKVISVSLKIVENNGSYW